MCSDGLTQIGPHHLDAATTYIQQLNGWLANPSLDTIPSIQEPDANPASKDVANEDVEPVTELNSNPNSSVSLPVFAVYIRRLTELFARVQESPLAPEEIESIHPILFALGEHATEEHLEDLLGALHFVIGWVLEEAFMVEDDVFFILSDGLEFFEALLYNQVKDAPNVVAGFLDNLGEWVESTVTNPPDLPNPETLPPVDSFFTEMVSSDDTIHADSVEPLDESIAPHPDAPSSNEAAVETPTQTPQSNLEPVVSETQQPAESSVEPQVRKKKKKSKPSDTKDKKDRKRNEPTFIQIEIEQVEALTHISGELQLHQSQIDKISKDLHRLTRDWTHLVQDEIIQQKRLLKAAGQNKAAMNQWIKMQALAKEFAVHLNQLREDILLSHVNLQEFQHRVGEIRLQKIGDLFNRFPRSIRDLAKEQGKKIQVILEGTDVSIDKTVIEALFDPMLHLVRNGVDHGIELPSDRLTAGKPERATLLLHAERFGDSVRVTIKDDGRGINPDMIRATLQRKQLMSDMEIQSLNEHQLIQQLFRPGFSTQVTVSHISGRGVGLDVVKSTVEKLGGDIIVESEVGIGTSFILTLPISVALTYALLVRVQEGYFAFPVQTVEKVLEIERSNIIAVGEGEAARMDDGTLLPIVGLNSLLEFDEHVNSNLVDNIVLLKSATSRVCVRVDTILGVRQLVQSNLPNFIRDIRIVSGTAMIEGGMVVQFLNVMYLLDLAVEYRKSTSRGQIKAKKDDVIRIMVAEDSDLTREMLVSRVSRMGYQVFEAVNGQDAWDQLDYRDVDLLMTDLDMPILNGFELIRRVRSSHKLQSIPIVVLSTRRTKESKQQAAQAGADAYIVKSAYNEEELASTFARLLSPSGDA
jgi:two-component system chemotaxis sensor kinase CheA